MKSNIPWENFCMRKYGTSIRDRIFENAKESICAMLRAKARKNAEMAPVRGAYAVPGLVGRC